MIRFIPERIPYSTLIDQDMAYAFRDREIMINQRSNVINLFLTVILVIGLFALSAQLYLIILNKVTSFGEVIIRYFSFFTILSNILVAVCAAILVFHYGSNWGRFFSRPSTLSAITVYIVVVGVVYNVALRQIWTPHGLQRIVDELLHLVIPALFLLYWIIYAPKQHLKWNISGWLIYPAVYAVLIMIRGALSGYYPYPFLDVTQLGYQRVVANSVILILVFLAFSLLLVAIAKLIARRQ